jgi:hypothetical protein
MDQMSKRTNYTRREADGVHGHGVLKALAAGDVSVSVVLVSVPVGRFAPSALIG